MGVLILIVDIYPFFVFFYGFFFGVWDSNEVLWYFLAFPVDLNVNIFNFNSIEKKEEKARDMTESVNQCTQQSVLLYSVDNDYRKNTIIIFNPFAYLLRRYH